MIREDIRSAAPGLPMLLACFTGMGFAIFLFVQAVLNESPVFGISSVVLGLSSFISLFGLCIVNPNESKVLVLFGKYRGTVKSDGWYWVHPFNVKHRLSLRIRNFETERLKVNDLDDRATQGQRSRWQPDRERGGRGVEGRRDRGGLVRSR